MSEFLKFWLVKAKPDPQAFQSNILIERQRGSSTCLLVPDEGPEPLKPPLGPRPQGPELVTETHRFGLYGLLALFYLCRRTQLRPNSVRRASINLDIVGAVRQGRRIKNLACQGFKVV